MNNGSRPSSAASSHGSRTRLPDAQLRKLQEMFSSKLDPDVVHMIFTESGNNFDSSFEQLLVLGGNAPKPQPSLTMAEIAKQMTGQAVCMKGKVASKSRLDTEKPLSCAIIPCEVSTALAQRNQVMILMRGLPGSGKSTLANKIVGYQKSRFKTAMKLSADDFFNRNGRYLFNPSMLPEAHDWTKERTVAACGDKISLIVIDNTNIEIWEMEPYAAIAAKYNYWLLLVEPDTEWKKKPNKCARFNSHGVPLEKIERMLSYFVNISASELMDKHIPKSKLNNLDPISFQSVASPAMDPITEVAASSNQCTVTSLGSQDEQKRPTKLNHIFDGAAPWAIPAFPSDPNPRVDIVKMPEICECRNFGTQTSFRDFALLETLQDGSDLLEISDDEVAADEINYEMEIPAVEVVKLNKGTDLPVFCGETLEEMVQGLKLEFPNLQEQFVIEILKNCALNRDWAISVLKSFDPQHFDDFSWIVPDDLDGASDISCPSDVTSSSSWIDVEKPAMPFLMSVEFACGLIEKFGHIEGSPFDTLQFELDNETCASIYEAWKRAVSEKVSKQEQPKEIEKTVQGPKNEFEEIVELEKALAESLRNPENLEVAKDRKRLHQAYPGIAQELLESVFAANKFNLEETLDQLHQDQSVIDTLVKQKTNGPQSRVFHMPNKLLTTVLPSKTIFPSSVPRDGEETRTKVKELYNKQQECVNRAKECVNTKKYAIASYYSEEALNCARKATRLITSSMTCTSSNTLDLHELRTTDALSALNEFIRAKRQLLENSKSQRITLDIITGWGSHGIPAKIKPAVNEYLKSNKLTFSQPNQGMFRVIITK